MADDIDIEEHDVLDNPRIRNIFPDLSRIKIEVLDSDDEDHHMQTECFDEPRVSNQSSVRFNHSPHKNSIVLGSKRIVDRINYEDTPVISDNHFSEEHFNDDTNVDYEFDNVQIKQELEDSHDEEIERHGSCIILGSKPNRSVSPTDIHDVYSSVVMLEDWGPKLHRSNCYCKDCEILFPTRNCLDAHNMAAHSFLVALSNVPESLNTSPTVNADVSVNKAMKSTTKSSNFSTESTLSKPSTTKEKFCNHCNKMFPSKTALITHLYENLTTKGFPCEKCDRIFNKESELIQHIKAHHVEEDDDKSHESNDLLYNQCDVCFCYFRRSFSRHMIRNHGKSKFSTEKVLFNGTCRLCGLKYAAAKYLNKHVSIVHSQYSLKPGKSSKILKPNITHNSQQVNSANSSDIRRPNFKCLKCGEVFAYYSAAKRHKKIKHPELKNRKVFSKVKRIPVPVPTKKLVKNTIKDKIKSVCSGAPSPLIPKSVLFKCHQCPLHFTNCTDAVFHASRCVKEVGVWNCDVCAKSFKLTDKIIHERQHILNNQFSVHLTKDNVYERTHCRCPYCEIYYSEQEFWIHAKQGCSQPRSVPCNICDILVHVSSTKMHEKFHNNKDYTLKDLILIEFVRFANEDSDNEGNLSVGNKRKISGDCKASASKKSKILTDTHAVSKARSIPVENIMYFCVKCKGYWKLPRVNENHLQGNCKNKKCRPCKKCGLYFSSDYHDIMMHKSNKTIFDYTFIRVQDNKIINPMPSYPRCMKCNVHSLSKKIKWHDCTNDYKICEYCDKKFTETSYGLHVNFHEYALRKRGKTGIIIKTKGNQSHKALTVEKPSVLSLLTKSSTGKSQAIPGLLEKYELMTNLWNILYLCEVCDIVCDSYDKMVEHSQDHFNKMESYDMTIANCEICDLRLDGTCFDKHKSMHENTTLNRQSFHILKYNYMNLFSDNWLELFRAIPRIKIEQIVSQSIYVRDRNIRMRLTQHGPAENTVYKCGRCNGYLTASMVGYHFEKPSCCSPRYKCKMCHLNFSMNVCLKEHQTVCRSTNQSYREVLFNDVSDVSFNKGLQMTWKSENSSTNTTHMETKDALYKFYKCEICHCCVMLVSGIHFHKCATPSERGKCDQCDLYFKSRTLEFHRPLHDRFPKMSKSTIMTIPFEPKSYKVLPKLYKCHCGLHFTSLQTAEKHLTLCRPNYQISKENCSKCGLLFPTSILVSHLCSHHSNDNQIEFNIQHMAPKKRGHILKKSKPIFKEAVKSTSNAKVTIHKCAQCNVCFLCKNSLVKHFKRNHVSRLDVQHCKLCDVNFTKHSMTKHVSLHHKVKQYSRADLNIKSYKNIANIKSEESTLDDGVSFKNHTATRKICSLRNIPVKDHNKYSKYLYKCRSCKIHFLSINGCASHCQRYHEKSRSGEQDSTNCSVCGLAFVERSLARHMEIHHKMMKLNREDFIIVQSGRNISKELYKCNRCDVHFLSIQGYIKHCSEGLHSIPAQACDICGYNFKSNVLPWHINTHHESQKLSRKDFNIITPVFEAQPSRFSGINKAKSMSDDYETQKHYKKYQNMEIQQYNSIVTNRLYKCRTCSVHFCKEKDLIDHVFEVSISGHKDNATKCRYCHLKFPPGKDIDRHINEQHEKLKLTKEFIIIENDIVDGAYASRYLYKCDMCNTNFVRETNAELHDHTICKRKCRLCGLRFSSDELDDHKKYHRNMMDMDRDDFNFVDISRTSEPVSSGVKMNIKKRKLVTMYNLSKRFKATLDMSKYDNTIYMCNCDLHFLTYKTFVSHLSQRCDRRKSTRASRVTCKSCGFLFSPFSLSLHQYIQHEKLNLKLKDFRIVTKKDLQQTNRTGLNNHDDSLDPNDVSEDIRDVSDVSVDLHDVNVDCSSAGPTDSIEQEQTSLNTEDDSESNENLNKSVGISRSGINFSRSYLSSLDVNHFGNLLYRCQICHKHYITVSAALKHGHNTPGKECSICGLVFTNYIMLKHKYIHHERLGLNRDDFSIQHNFAEKIGYLKYDSRLLLLYKCDICDMHFIKFTSAHAHTEKRCAKAMSEEEFNCQYCGLRFSTCSLETHETEYHRKRKLERNDLNIIHYSGATRKTKDNVGIEDISSIENCSDLDESEISIDKAKESETDSTKFETNNSQMESTKFETNNSQMEVSLDDLDSNVSKLSTADSSKSSPQKTFIKLYKCGDCNVFYITQNTCYKHVLHHKPLDSLDYIECKLCGLPFCILTLHKHMLKHHKSDFNLKNVLIEEYQSKKGKMPKIDIYYALDKVQSRLVSTTTDNKDVSEAKVDSTVEDVAGPVDGEEKPETDTLYTEGQQTATNSTANNITVATVIEDIAKNNSSHEKEEIESENAVKLVSSPIKDENLTITTDKDNSHLSLDEVVATSSVRNSNDKTIHKAKVETNVKNVDHVVEQMMSESTAEDNSNPSAKEIRACSDA